MILAGDFIPKTSQVRLSKEFAGQIVLANLEGPICADGLPQSNKVGVCLHTSRDSFKCTNLPRFAFSLANNHMMDFREEGLRQTKEFLSKQGMMFAGAGADEASARKPMILEENGKRIAVFCCCERQFGMASEGVTGCAEKGLWLYQVIRDVKRSGQADFVVVSCHAANEFCPWPSPRLRDFYCSLIDAGADVIHGHHAHVPQGVEELNVEASDGGRRRAVIFYGLGNFVVKADDWGEWPHYRWSLIAEVSFDESGISFVTKCCQCRVEDNVIRIEFGCNECMSNYLKLANSPFAGGVSLVALWQEASCRLYRMIYAQSLRAASVESCRLSLRDRARKLYFAGRDILRVLVGREYCTVVSIRLGRVIYNYFNNESHTETIRTALGVLTGVEPDFRTEETRRIVEGILFNV